MVVLCKKNLSTTHFTDFDYRKTVNASWLDLKPTSLPVWRWLPHFYGCVQICFFFYLSIHFSVLNRIVSVVVVAQNNWCLLLGLFAFYLKCHIRAFKASEYSPHPLHKKWFAIQKCIMYPTVFSNSNLNTDIITF